MKRLTPYHYIRTTIGLLGVDDATKVIVKYIQNNYRRRRHKPYKKKTKKIFHEEHIPHLDKVWEKLKK